MGGDSLWRRWGNKNRHTDRGAPHDRIDLTKAAELGRRDGRSRPYLYIYAERPEFEPPNLRSIYEQFEIDQANILQQRDQELARLQENAQRTRTALESLRSSKIELDRRLNELEEDIRGRRLALESGPQQPTQALGMVGLSDEAEELERTRIHLGRTERDNHKVREQLTAMVADLRAAEQQWLQVYRTALTRLSATTAHTNQLIDRYRAEFVQAHKRGADVIDMWIRREVPLPAWAVEGEPGELFGSQPSDYGQTWHETLGFYQNPRARPKQGLGPGLDGD